METGTPSRTAEAIAAARAFGSHLYRSLGILDDPYAQYFLRPKFYKRLVLVRRLSVGPGRSMFLRFYERKHPGALGWALCRHRYMDDLIKEAVGEGVSQVVLLGAGYDTRAFRLGLPNAVSILEIDHPATQAVKLKVIRNRFGQPPDNASYLPMDVTATNLRQVVGAAGFDARRPTLFVLEGFLWYLEPSVATEILRSIKWIAPSGSSLVADYVLPEVVEGGASASADAQAHRELSRRWGEPILSGIEPTQLGAYLRDVDMRLTDDVGPDELASRYGAVSMHPYFRIMRAEIE